MADACTPCPNYIKAAVRRPVLEATRQVLAIKKRVLVINDAIGGTLGDLAAKIAAVVGAVPVPPLFNPVELALIIACPLTPLALALDAALLAQLDPRELYRQVQRVLREFSKTVISDYEAGLESLTEYQTVRIIQRFLRDLKKIGLDVEVLAKAVAISAYVKTTCDEEYVEGPYAAFDDAITDFSLTGVVPSGLDSDVSSAVLELQVGSTKIGAWQALATTPPPL